MQTSLSDCQINFFRYLCAAVLLAGAASYVVCTLHWQWMWDTQVMHYIVLLLNHGKVPYKEIYDLNMPGSYLTERWAIGIFGSGDLGWRLYDFTLLGSMTLAMIVIALPYDWLAGLFAGVLFTLLNGLGGPAMAVERDEVMTVLIFIGYALLMLAVRKSRPWLMLPYGLAMGLAVLIKPTVAPLALGLLLFPFFVLRREGRSPVAFLMYALTGFALALGILLHFLLPQHAFGPFLFILHKLVPYYVSLVHPTLLLMILLSLPPIFLIYVPITLLLGKSRKQRTSWEMWAVRAGFLFGILSYFLQHKGYGYHRIASVSFGLLWVGLELSIAMKDRGRRRNIAVAAMAFGVLLMVPFDALKISRMRVTNAAVPRIEQDLRRLGGDKLQNKVQCLDMVGGCFTALYHLDLVQSTGFTGDTEFFDPNDNTAVPYYRKIFMQEIHKNQPTVIVLSNEWYQNGSYTFDKLNAWPEFRDYLNANYRLDTTEGPFELCRKSTTFRIYILRDAAHI